MTKPDSLKNISVSKNEADSHALPKSAFYLQRDIKIFSKIENKKRRLFTFKKGEQMMKTEFLDKTTRRLWIRQPELNKKL